MQARIEYLFQFLYYMLSMARDLVFLHSNCVPDCASRVDKHFADYYTLQFMSGGGVELSYDSEAHAMTGRWFWTAFPGPHIRFHPGVGHATWNHRYVAFRGPLMRDWLAAGIWLRGAQPAPPGRDYEGVFDNLLVQAQRGDRWGAARGANLLESLLLELAEERARPAPREAWLAEVMAALEHEALDYAALAAQCGMGLSTLRRRFRATTGLPLHTYVLQTRMERARKLLGESDLPIKAIAERLGYSDVYFFSRQFAQLVGATPAGYRKSRQS